MDDQASIQIRWLKVGNTAVNGSTVQSPGTSGLDEIVVTAGSVAPIDLLFFSAKNNKNRSIALSWTTTTEINNAFFSIERSNNGNRFMEIGRKLGAGTSQQKQHYSYNDDSPVSGPNYYRLRQVDFDGKFEYSPVVIAALDVESDIRLSPMPVLHQIQVQLGEVSQDELTWQIFDYAGRAVLSGSTRGETTAFEINMLDVASGAYVLRIVSGEKTWVKPFQKT